MITQDLGIATAYGYAKSKGYTGTEDEFATLMASYASVAQQAADYANAASASATEAGNDVLKSEGYAVGKQNGTDVPSGSPYYHNNAKYFSEQAGSAATSAATDVVNTHNVDATAHANLYVRAGKKANTTLGSRATAEGQNTTASATNSHAEGGGTTASGLASHAEGGTTVASGDFSHAEGNYTAAIGSYSHAEGNYTVASHRSQHVFGEYNKYDTSQASSTSKGTYIEIVGNGANDNNRRNARTLDWAGNEVLAGSLQTGSSIVAGGRVTVGLGPSGDMDLATKSYVDGAISDMQETVDAELENKANVDGYYESLVSGGTTQIISSSMSEDKTPYNFRTSGGSADIGDRAYDTLVGGTVVWNQMAHALTTDDWTVAFGSEFTGTSSFVDGVATIHIDSATASVAALRLKSASAKSSISGHKYLFSAVIQTTNGKATFVPTLLASDGMSGYTSYPTKTRVSWFWDCGTGNENCAGIRVGTGSGITGEVDVTIEDYNAYDLTQMFGPAIADYVYGLEQATPGAGVAWFRKLFPKDYYAYDAGSLQSVQAASHEMVGFNAYDHSTGKAVLLGGNQYQFTGAYTSLAYTDINGDSETITPDSSGLFTPTSNGTLTVTGGDGTTTCVHLVWSGYRNGEYEPYVKRSYALDDTLTLRGIPKLDAANNLYYDGDAYESDGTVTRKYGIVDLGTLEWSFSTGYGFNMFYTDSLTGLINSANGNNFICGRYSPTTNSWATMPDDSIRKTANAIRLNIHDDSYTDAATFKAAMSGVHLVYELATPTAETAESFHSPQVVDDFGTEEYTDAGVNAGTREVAIPVGHVTRYPANLRDKLQHLPDLADNDGLYAISQTGTTMTLTEIPEAATNLPDAPTTDGTYTLQVTVADGTATYAWVAAT